MLIIANSAAIPRPDIQNHKELRALAATLAYTGRGDLFKARGRTSP